MIIPGGTEKKRLEQLCTMSVRMTIEDNQDTVNALMKKLKNPPDEYKDAYDAVSDLYDAHISLTNCATDPSGSLQDRHSAF